MIYTEVGNVKALVSQQTFPGGEVMVKLNQKFVNAEDVTIVTHIKNSEDIMSLLMTVDAIRREKSSINVSLKLPYVPYARQDRVCNEGESLSVHVFANLINSCGFKNVYIVDPHSDVTSALINNVVVTSQESIFLESTIHGKISMSLHQMLALIKSRINLHNLLEQKELLCVTRSET